MSHHDENTGASGAFGSRGPGLADERLPQMRRATSDTDAESAALRRDLLLYGTAGQAAPMRAGARPA